MTKRFAILCVVWLATAPAGVQGAGQGRPNR